MSAEASGRGAGGGPPGSNRTNNFDLIRLFAALQVVCLHSFGHLKVPVPRPAIVFLDYFSGVPIFFVISGFLISMAWDRAPVPRQYAWNRLLRIYPALWACLLVCIVLFLSCGVRPDSAKGFGAWLLAQLTIFQFYNPDFLRGFGTGVLNGALWTIPIELQFYILLPLLATAAKDRRLVWAAFILASAAMMVVSTPSVLNPLTMFQKLLSVSIVPWLFYFMVGVMTRLLFEAYPSVFKGKGLAWTGVYALWMAVEIYFQIGGRHGKPLNIVTLVLLGMLAVSLAFTRPRLSSALLKGNDISYGVYLYHIPVINLMLFLGIGGTRGFTFVLAGALAAAALSWRLIERPALALKNYSPRPAGG